MLLSVDLWLSFGLKQREAACTRWHGPSTDEREPGASARKEVRIGCDMVLRRRSGDGDVESAAMSVANQDGVGVGDGRVLIIQFRATNFSMLDALECH